MHTVLTHCELAMQTLVCMTFRWQGSLSGCGVRGREPKDRFALDPPVGSQRARVTTDFAVMPRPLSGHGSAAERARVSLAEVSGPLQIEERFGV
jgi:hypothetical protein